FYIHNDQSMLDSWRSYLLIQTQKRPKILHGIQNANRAILQSISKSKSEIDICGNHIIQLIESELFKKALSDARARGVRVRCIIEITKVNIYCYKKLMKLVQIRHLDGLKAKFILTNTKCLSITATTTNALQERKTVPQIMYIDTMQIVEQYHQIFDTLWNNATTISAQERIKQIEEGVKPFTLDITQDRIRAESLFLAQIQQARSEVLIAVNSIVDLEHLATSGLVDSIKQAKRRGVSIMVLHSEEEGKGGGEKSRNVVATLPQLISDIKRCAQIKRISGIQGIILLIDNAKLLTISYGNEDKDDGLAFIAIYSDNKSLAKNFGSLLDSLLNETEMLESMITAKDDLADLNKQLAEANEQLMQHDRMQREFINIAAHELRTPIQSILGYAELLEVEQEDEILTREEGRGGEIKSTFDNNKSNSLMALVRNANRLEQLSQLILDVTRIENKSLNLNKERLNLKDVILTAIDDLVICTVKDPNKNDNNNLKLRYEPIENDIFIDVDKSRLTQVISNLLRNAVKFTEEGDITIKAEKEEDHVLIKIKDTGSGIDPEISPRLFTKFATKSDEGIGLGLFISKAIVEAHGGRIWAENNKECEKRGGATFTFNLPLSKK
ncbi:MAG TPA: ATP-binding protein, partial [Nitrososphaeraceae archaeon]|nr:ATP-binding protein [Nitrososphaeraceae archaeon]